MQSFQRSALHSFKRSSYTRSLITRMTVPTTATRTFSTTHKLCQNEEPVSSFEKTAATNKNKLEDFPWLMNQDKPRIPIYPYEEAPRDWSYLNMLPVTLQKHLARWLGTRILQLNTGFDNFPEQFLVGASLATRNVLELLSEQLNNPDETRQEQLESVMGPDLLARYLQAVPANTHIDIQVPQIYDVNLDDIWLTMGNPAAFSDEQGQYQVLRWMTIQIGLHKATVKEEEEPFQDYRQRISKSILEGTQVGVDVLIDADVIFSAKEKGKEEGEVLVYDEGRRTIRMRFATPFFSPASKMVSGRDAETQEPINDWNWRLVDIDQLLEKEAMHEE